MLVSIWFTLSAALLTQAQSTTNNTQLGIEAIEAHFSNAGIVPSLLKQFSPSSLLILNYNGVGTVQPGQNLTVNQVKPVPDISVTPANSSISLAGNYTLAMVDANVVGTDETQNQTRHWLVNDVTVSGNRLSMDSAINITSYAGPLPPTGSGPHRYVFVLYTQPSNFSPPSNLAQPNQPVALFDLNQYVDTSALGPIFAGMYYDVQQGPSSVTATTSPVVTSTLPAATSSGTSSAAPSPTSGRNGASTSYNLNTGFAGLLAFVGFLLAA